MQIKNNIDSVTFGDGYLYVLKFLDNGEIDYKSKQLFYFGVRTLTQKRLDEAAQIQARYDLCVHIPYVSGTLKEDDIVLLRGEYYRIEQIQHILTTNPPISVLTLSRWEMDGEGGE